MPPEEVYACAFCIKEHLNKMYEHPYSGKQDV